MYDTPPSVAQEGITISSPIFYDDDFLWVSYSDEEDQIQHDHLIETEYQEILDPNPRSIPNQNTKPRWARKLLDAAGSGARNTEDKRRTRSQYQNEHVALSLTYSLPTEWCNKVLGKYYMMIANDQPLDPHKKKIEYRRNT